MKSTTQLFDSNLKKHDELKDFDNASFRSVLALIDNNRKLCQEKKLTGDAALDLMKLKVIAHEMEQKVPRFLKWNVTVYPPKKDETEYSYQFCSPPPNCTRIFISFDQKNNGEPRLTISEPCIVPNPDLTAVKAHYGSAADQKAIATDITMADTIKQFDEIKLQRVAIVGFARNFPDYMHDESKEFIIEQVKETALYQMRALYATEAIDSFLGQLESLKIPFTTVNGGWAGQKQKTREVGITFMGHLHGVIHENDDVFDATPRNRSASPRSGYYPPLTVMPTGGSSDSVNMMASTSRFLDTTQKETVKREDTIGSRSQFIIEGNWGSDSPYLAALSTSMVVIEPAGRWTQIEMLNAMEQGRPVVILASPENYDSGWMKDWGNDNVPDPQYVGLTEGKPFVEIPFPTPSDAKAVVRAYKNPIDAANYIAWRYEVDHIPSIAIKSLVSNVDTQQRLSKLISDLMNEKNDLKDIERVVADRLTANATDRSAIEIEFKNLNKLKTIEKLKNWLSPDYEQKTTGYVTPRYIASPAHLWARGRITTTPVSSTASTSKSSSKASSVHTTPAGSKSNSPISFNFGMPSPSNSSSSSSTPPPAPISSGGTPPPANLPIATPAPAAPLSTVNTPAPVQTPSPMKKAAK